MDILSSGKRRVPNLVARINILYHEILILCGFKKCTIRPRNESKFNLLLRMFHFGPFDGRIEYTVPYMIYEQQWAEKNNPGKKKKIYIKRNGSTTYGFVKRVTDHYRWCWCCCCWRCCTMESRDFRVKAFSGPQRKI